MASILDSNDKPFLISHRFPGSSMTELALACVDFQRSVQAHPAALYDGQFLVYFCTYHPSDRYYNTINQHYWLDYHPVLSVADPHCKHSTHMIHPPAHSPDYAIPEDLRLFSQWVQLTNADTYIAGPFNFAVVNNRKSRYIFSIEKWEQLIK